MRHIRPLVDWEVDEGSGTDVRLYSTLYDYPVVDEPWPDFIAPGVVPLKEDPDQLEVHKMEVCE